MNGSDFYPSSNTSFVNNSDFYPSENASFASSLKGHESIHERVNLGEWINEDVQETRLVIGLEYGTTYTSVAYATPSGSKCPLEDIDVMVEWGATMNEKLPSVTSYLRSDHEWSGALSAKSIPIAHPKLELALHSHLRDLKLDSTLQSSNEKYKLNVDGVFAHSHNSAEHIVAEDLGEIFQHLKIEIDRFGPIARRHTATDLVITIPTDWTYIAMNSTYRALAKAGFSQVNFPKLRDVMFITNPEAAVIYTARYYRDDLAQTTLQEGQYMIFCDAGSNTVDVASYQVKRLEPALELEPVGLPTGDKCGLTFINMEFKRWLRMILTDFNYRKLDPNVEIDESATYASETPAMRSLMEDFDLEKKHFTVGSSDCRIELPPPLQNLVIPGRVNQGLLTIKRHEMECFFDASIRRIVILIKSHVKRIREQRDGHPKNLFLVGGYSESEYLQAKIKEMLLHERLAMLYWRPRDSWTAAVRGAVVCGIEKHESRSLKRTSSCRHSYAICLDEIYALAHHGKQKQKMAYGGGIFAEEQLTWLLKKGDLVLFDQSTKRLKKIHIRLAKRRQDVMTLKIWQYTSDENHRTKRLRDAGKLAIDLSRVQFDRVRQGLGKPTYFTADLELVLELKWTELRADLWWKKTKLTSIPVLY